MDLTAATRERLQSAGVPYAMEGVVGTPFLSPVMLCGTSFGLPIFRHRLFESSHLLLGLPCEHWRQTERKYWTGYGPRGVSPKGGRRSRVVQVYGNGGDMHLWGPALGIDWMTNAELTQAIPPAYTEHIGRQLLDAVHHG